MVYKIRKFEEKFASGKAGMVANKLSSIIAKRLKDTAIFADLPMNYENDYGVFEGYLFKLKENDIFIRINFLKESSDSVFSFDVYLRDLSQPSYVVDVLGMNIIEVVNTIVDALIEDGVLVNPVLAERGRPTKNPEDYVYIIEKWIEEDSKILDILQRKSLTITFSKDFLPWVKDKPRYKDEVKYGLFIKTVKYFLLNRGMTNKFFRKKKKGVIDRVAEDPILAAQFDDIVSSITSDEKFNLLKGALTQMVKGSLKSIFLYGDPGCLSGDTLLRIRRSKRAGYRTYSIQEAFIKFNSIGKGEKKREKGFKYWDSSYETNILSYNSQGYLEYSPIKGITSSGKKEVFEMVLEDNKKIKASTDHKFMIKDFKYEKLGNLRVNDFILVQDIEKKTIGKQKGRREVNGIPFHPNAYKKIVRGFNYKRYPYAKLLWEANLNNISIIDFIEILKNDKEKAKNLEFIEKGLEIHHRDWDQTNDIISNLEVLTKKDHSKVHKLYSQIANKEARTSFKKIISIKSVGIEETYDIEMKNSTQASFLAEGIIVHNSGKSYETIQTLDSLNANYKVYKGGFKDTNALVRVLYNNRQDYILVFDDADSMRTNKDQNNILKAALDSTGQRTITWVDTKRASNKGMSDVPQQFDFESSIVFISNSTKIDPAVKSRSFPIEITLSNSDMVDRMEAKLKAYRPDIDMAVKKEALDYAREIAQGVTTLDFRSLDLIITCIEIGGNWKRNALLMLKS